MDEVKGYLVKVEAKILHLLQDLISLFFCLFLVEKNCIIIIKVKNFLIQHASRPIFIQCCYRGLLCSRQVLTQKVHVDWGWGAEWIRSSFLVL